MKLIEASTQEDVALLASYARQAIEESGGDPIVPNGPSAFWLIEGPDDFVGSAGVYGIDWQARRCRGMLYITPENRGNGLSIMAHKLLEEQVFNRMNLRKLEGVVRSDNAPMIALMESVGCEKEGELKDVSYEAGRYRSYILYRLMRKE